MVTRAMKIELVAFDAVPAIRTVREAVFIQEQHVPVELEWDGEDRQACHAVAMDESGTVIGTGRMLADGHIGRMAVLKTHRHQGAGRAMLGALLEEARRRRLSMVFLYAQISAVDFYRRFGFVAEGEVFMDAGIPHRHMRLELSD